MLHEVVNADWARLGKLPGDHEDYRILARSRGEIDVSEIAGQYIAGVPGTDAPKDAPWGPPWVTFGAHQTTDGRPVISVSVQYPWEGRDGAGRPIWPRDFFACRSQDMTRGGVSYQTLYAAIEHFKLPSDAGSVLLMIQRQPLDGEGGLMAAVAAYGFESVAAIAAALLDGPVTVGGCMNMRLDQRLRLLDAAAALLPYGLRADLSASSAVGGTTTHRIRLALTDLPMGNQHAVFLDAPAPPHSDLGRRYFEMLLKHQESSGLAAVVRYLWGSREPLVFSHPAAAVEILAQLNLQDYLSQEIRASDRVKLSNALAILDGQHKEVRARWQLERTRDPRTPGKLLMSLLETEDPRADKALRQNWEIIQDDLAELANRELNQGRVELAERSLEIAGFGQQSRIADELLVKLLVPAGLKYKVWPEAIRFRVALLQRVPVPHPGIFTRTCDDLRYLGVTDWQGEFVHALLSAELAADKAGARAAAWASWLCMSPFAGEWGRPEWVGALGFAVSDLAEAGSADNVRPLVRQKPDWAVLILRLARSSGRLRAALEIWDFDLDLLGLGLDVMAAAPVQESFRVALADILNISLWDGEVTGETIACVDVARVVLGGPPSDFPHSPSNAQCDMYLAGLERAFQAHPGEPWPDHVRARFLEHVIDTGVDALSAAAVKLLDSWIRHAALAPDLARYITEHHLAEKLLSDPRLGSDFWALLTGQTPQLTSHQASQVEAKVLLLGEGTVGKTSLAAALRGDPFQDHELTHGIEVHALVTGPAPRVLLHLWDFGGQETYRTTHEFFLSPDALHLVVWNARAGHRKDDVAGWLSRIRRRIGTAARVMLVATHSAQCEPVLDYAALERDFPGMLVGQHAVDSKTGKGIAELASAIREQAIALDIGRLLPDSWLEARDRIFSGGPKRPHMSYQEFTEICTDCGVSGAETEALARLLHQAGRIIYHADDETLADMVILDPEWLSKAIGYVLADKQTRLAGGVLDHRRLAEIWPQRPGEMHYMRHQYPYFLRLMEKFDISYRLEDGHHSLIAQLISARKPVLPWDQQTQLPVGVRRLTLICALSVSAIM